jgi:hypothetical protein
MTVQFSWAVVARRVRVSRDLGGITGQEGRVSRDSVKKITCNVSSHLRVVPGGDCYRDVTSHRGPIANFLGCWRFRGFSPCYTDGTGRWVRWVVRFPGEVRGTWGEDDRWCLSNCRERRWSPSEWPTMDRRRGGRHSDRWRKRTRLDRFGIRCAA